VHSNRLNPIILTPEIVDTIAGNAEQIKQLIALCDGLKRESVVAINKILMQPDPTIRKAQCPMCKGDVEMLTYEAIDKKIKMRLRCKGCGWLGEAVDIK